MYRQPDEASIQVYRPKFEPFVCNMINKTNKARVYDFSRTAKAKIREEMVSYLSSVLPGSVYVQYIRGAFDRLFTYQAGSLGYKGFLEEDGQMRSEWLMLQIPVYNGGALQSVAHVYFDSLTHRTGPLQFTVRVRVGAIVQCVTNPPVSVLNASSPVIPYPPNPLNDMMLNACRLVGFNHGAQGCALPINAFGSAQGFYNVGETVMPLPYNNN